MDIKQKLTKARTRLILSQPFFGSLALRMALIEQPDIDTMATDGKAVFYNPAFVDGLSMDELVGVFAHEVMHPACNHHTRRGERDPERWNAAADYAINPILIESGFTLPADALIDPSHAGQSAEAIYNRLPPPSEGGGANAGNQSGNGDGSSLQAPDPGRCGGVIDAPGKSQTDNAQAEAEWRQALAQAATLAKNAGKMPGDLERLVEETLNPKADWRDLLRRFVEMSAKQEYRWTPPNRRFVHQGLYLPSCRSEQMPPIVVAIDTSGSVSQNDVNQFAAELTDIFMSCAPEEIHVVYCDSRIRNVESFTPQDLPLALRPRGGGGTDFAPPFEWVEDANINPACIVYMTDLIGHSYPNEPDCPTLWVTTSSGDTLDLGYHPPFGEIVHMG